MIAGQVFDIQRMSVHDGPGIRTTVFLKGCPLRCLWCHNPESQRMQTELAVYEDLCIGCGECIKACSFGVHSFVDGRHLIDRIRCTHCGACARVCVGALEMLGCEMSVSQVMYEIEKDLAFYRASTGGLTLSGGEPLAQPRFSRALLEEAGAKGIHRAIETSGYAERSVIEQLIPVVDLWLYDIKESDEERHIRCTGAGRSLIMGNLKVLNAAGTRIILRCPVIPGINDREEHLSAIAKLAEQLDHVEMVHIEPYNRLGEGKSHSIGKKYLLHGIEAPENAQVNAWIQRVQRETTKIVVQS